MPGMVSKLSAVLVLLITLGLAFGGCAAGRRVNLDPMVNLAVAPSSLADRAAVYIPPLNLKQVHRQALPGLGNVDVPLGPALAKCARESFQLFFGQVLMLGPNETSSLPWRLDLRLDRFRINDHLGVELAIWCKVVHSGKIVLEQSFTGQAAGPDEPSSRLDLALPGLQRSAESAFQQAFTALQKALREATAANN